MYGTGWDSPKRTEGVEEELTKPCTIIYHQSWLTREASTTGDWSVGCPSIGMFGRRIQGIQAWEGYETDYLECHHTAHRGQLGIGPILCRFRKGRFCLTAFYDRVTHPVGEGKTVDAVYVNFTKAFDTVSQTILLENLAAHG